MDDYTPTERSLRYHELETIRQFALEKMVETDEVNSLRDRHLQYFLQIAEQAEIGMRGSDDLMWLERLEAEYENCRVALSCAMESTAVDPQVALKFSSALRDFWNIHGHSNEGFHWLMNSLNHAGDTSTIYRCKALCGLANLPMSSEQRNEIKDLINIAVPLARQLDVPNLILEALYYSITKYGNNLLDDADETRKRMDECLALAHLSNNQFFLIYVLGFRNWYFVHDAGERMKLADDVYKIAIELGNKRALAEALSTLGHMYRSQGHYEKASLAIKECLRLSKELGDRHETVWYYWAICNIENQKGDLSSALQFAEDGLHLARDLSDPLYTSYLLLGLGWNAYLSSDYKKAYACLEECLAIRRDLGVKSFLLSPLICLGPVAFTQEMLSKQKIFFPKHLLCSRLLGNIGYCQTALSG